MDLIINKKKLNQTFKEYENFQIKHINIVKTNNIPNIRKISNEREQAFKKLKICLIKLAHDTKYKNNKSINILSLYSKRLQKIMNQDDILKDEIKLYKKKLGKKLKQMKKGKQALRGYSLKDSLPVIIKSNQ